MANPNQINKPPKHTARALDWAAVFLQVLSIKKLELLPGDRENVAIQTRGGPQKHEATGWALLVPVAPHRACPAHYVSLCRDTWDLTRLDFILEPRLDCVTFSDHVDAPHPSRGGLKNM